MADGSDGWDLTGIPRPLWPYVRDILAARELYRLATLVSDKAIGERLQNTAQGVLNIGAKGLAQHGAKA
jgi:hypothetical protein